MTTRSVGKMKAFVYDDNGQNRMTFSNDFPAPEINENQVLVKAEAASLNPFDFRVTESESMFTGYRGSPVGCDFAGTIVQTGDNVENFEIGDRVFGWGPGLAEFVISDPSKIALIPDNMNAHDFAILPCVAVTALQLLEKHWLNKPDFQVRNIGIIGAAGGVGSALIQMAREFGGPELKIFAVSSQKNQEYLESIGATTCVDNTRSGFDMSTCMPEKSMDLIVDLVTGVPGAPCYIENGMRLIKPNTGKYITLNPLDNPEQVNEKITNIEGINLRQNYDFFIVKTAESAPQLERIAELVKNGKLKMPIADDLQFNDQSIRSGFEKLKQSHHTRGKFRVTIS